MRILLVEDDFMLGESVQMGLAQRGYAVDWVRDGERALLSFETTHYDAIVLDLGLPKRDGMSVLVSLRKRAQTTPVIVVTARDSVKDRIGGLDAGADDYLSKPFDLDELDARVRAVVRRHSRAGDSAIIAIGEVQIDLAAKRVRVASVAVEFTAREFAVLEYLVVRRQRVVSRADLEDAIYSWGSEVESNVVEVYVSQIRKKLGRDFIVTRRGIGYQLGGAT